MKSLIKGYGREKKGWDTLPYVVMAWYLIKHKERTIGLMNISYRPY
jgi:hypothetical protein